MFRLGPRKGTSQERLFHRLPHEIKTVSAGLNALEKNWRAKSADYDVNRSGLEFEVPTSAANCILQAVSGGAPPADRELFVYLDALQVSC